MYNSRNPMKRLLNKNMKQINFADEPEKCVKQINGFFKKITKFSYHKNMLMRSAITLKTQMIIANAAYFSGHWVF